MNKIDFINKTCKLFKINSLNLLQLDKQLATYKNFLQLQNKYTNLTRLDNEKII